VAKKEKYRSGKYIIITNNLSVFCFFNDIKKIKCLNLEEKITTRKNLTFYKYYYKQFLTTLKKIGSNKYFELKFNKRDNLNWLFSIYKYKPMQEYAAFNRYYILLKAFIKKKKINKLIVFNDFSSLAFLDKEDYIKLNNFIASELNINFEVINIKSQKKYFYNLDHIEILKINLKYIISIFKNLYSKLKINFDNKFELIATLQPYYELKYFNIPYKFIIFRELDYIIEKIKYRLANKKIELTPADYNKIKDLKNFYSQNIAQEIVLEKILTHFSSNINFYRNYCLKIKKKLEKNNIKKVIWGMPPANPDLRLALISYLKSNNFKIIGIQHGGCYGDQNYDLLQILTDYLNCNTFYSYENFKVNYSKNLFKSKDIAKIKKKGSLKQKFYSKNYFRNFEPKNILYAITHWTRSSIVFPGVTPKYMHDLQKQILNLLNKNQKKSTVVKFSKSFSNIQDDSIYPGHLLVKKFNNFIIESKKNLIDSINFYKPELIILDTYTTTLHETYNTKSEIICFLDKGSPVKNSFKRIYSKRVHFVENINQFKDILKKYQNNKLIRKAQ